jgi:hypothetical protein
MTQTTERRRGERRTDDDDLSPEYLALLEVCGGEIRSSDRALLTQRRRSAEVATGGAVPEPAAEPSAESAPADRRAAKAG